MPQSKQKDQHGHTPDNYQPLPNKEAIIHFNGKTLLTSKSYLEVKAYEHAIAFTVAGLMNEDLLKDVRDAIKSAMENGTDFNTFKKRLKPYLMAKGWLAQTLDDGTQTLVVGSHRRLRTIYHTNKQTAYAAGQWQRIQKTKEFLPYLQYMPSVSENPRLSHKRYYDLVRPVDDAIWKSIKPPNSFGCKCWVKQLTKRQAEKVGISEETPLEMVDYENPKTGEKSQVPAGIDPSFNHNHDRLTALLKLAQEKHGSPFTQALQAQLTDFMLDMAKNKGVAVANFTGVVARQEQIDRLKMELDNTVSLSEGVVGDEWQQYHNVVLERYNSDKHKVKVVGQPADFATIEHGVNPNEWLTIDFMFTMTYDNLSGIQAMNYSIDGHKRQKRNWQNLQNQIMEHLAKAEVVPMDLRHWNAQNSVKIIAFVLSLDKELQEKIVFIAGK